MRTARDVLLLALRAALLALLVTWALPAAEPSRLFRIALPIAALALLGPLLWPAARAAWLGSHRRWLRIPDLVVFNLLLFVLLGEIAIKILGAFSSSPLLVAPNAKAQERIARWRGSPGGPVNDVRFNSLGYFDREFERDRPPDSTRIVALGDSFAVGVVPYAQNFLTRLEDALADRRVEVLNFGVVATGPEDYLYLYRTEAAAYEPDLVLLHFFVGNDFRKVRSASLLHRDSLRTAAVVRRLLRVVEPRRATGAGAPPAPGFSEAEFLALERGRLEICRVPPKRATALAFEHTLAVLDQIVEAVPRLRVVLVPDEYQVDDALFAALVPQAERLQFDRRRPQQVVRAFLEARGVPVLDLLEALRRAQRDGPTYRPRDTHWNETGNRVAAAEIERWLRSDADLRPR